MAARWERYLDRWTDAGLIESATAGSIRAYETEREKAGGLGWPVLLAIALGGLLLASGTLLLVAAHWEMLSPGSRFVLVLMLIAAAHVTGALTSSRFAALSTTMHAVGTICLGAGIYLTAQAFHLEEHWPSGVLLWALGAWAAWIISRGWPQATLAAILTPAWLTSEWLEATRGLSGSNTIATMGLLMLAVSYLTALRPGIKTSVRRALVWIGGMSLFPAVASVIGFAANSASHPSLPWGYRLAGCLAAFLLPLALAWWLRGTQAWFNLVAAAWVAGLTLTALRAHSYFSGAASDNLGVYAACFIGSLGLIAWGLKESRKERVNLGIAGFALTVLFFYFSTVMDKLGRSASLIGLGILFLLGGFLLEMTRRRLLTRLDKGGE